MFVYLAINVEIDGLQVWQHRVCSLENVIASCWAIMKRHSRILRELTLTL